jgi:hypothetical protein
MFPALHPINNILSYFYFSQQQKKTGSFKFVRVDLYNVNGKIYFGGITFPPGNSFEKFLAEKYDYIWIQ